ncbi:unnamed protein product [Trichogramma brassicae]|uniref:RNA-directed DNA polymerase n=1 Tax=Trichogramma brassicae TaxID=86971 RepID=A0A6H5J4A1_9HYME|nr:unnamed protein product [Trichogramma brassicae]
MATIVDFPVQHRIVTSGQPVFARPRRLAGDRLAAAKAEFKKLLDRGIIRPSSSQWASPLHLVPKPGNTWRITGDYRLLNARTQPDRHPLPIIEDLLQESVGKVFSVVDLYKAFYQIPVAEEDISKTAVTTPFGLFEFVGMPLGLRNSAQTFQRTMNYLLRDLDFVRCYQDDILVLSASHEQHLQHLRELLTILKRARLFVNWEKCQIGRSEVVFAGYLISERGFEPPAAKVEAIARFPKPSDSTQLRRFIGMLNFYRRCLPRAAELMSPLTDLLRGLQKKKEKLAWSAQADEAFERIKQAMASAVRSAFYHPGQPLALHTDASNTAIGAALSQRHADDDWTPLGFLLAEVITNSAEVLNVRSRAAGHLRGDQIFSEDTRGSKLHHHDRSSPSVLRPRAEVGQVLAASTVTSARLHLALRCQDRLHARRREPSGRRSISHRRDYDANDAQLGPNQRGTAEGRTTNTSPRQGETQASRRRDRRTFPCLRRAAKRPEAIPTRESTSTGFRHGSHSLSSERQSYREASRAAILLAVDEQGHRALGEAMLLARDTPWTLALPGVLLGLRTTSKRTCKRRQRRWFSARRYAYPGSSSHDKNRTKTSPSEFVSALRRLFQAIRPVPASRHVQHRPFVFKDLATSDYVFRRLDTILKPLEQPYTGPHRVIRRINERNFVVDVNGVAKTLSLPISSSQPTWMSPTAEHHRQHRSSQLPRSLHQHGESPFHSLRKLPSPLGGE